MSAGDRGQRFKEVHSLTFWLTYLAFAQDGEPGIKHSDDGGVHEFSTFMWPFLL